MSLIGNIGGEAGEAQALEAAKQADAVASINSDFRFVPCELADKCRTLIESFHAIYGYLALPDMLWLSDARGVIERHDDLTKIFKRASRSRGAKRANDAFLQIATLIVSLEVLARDFASWGKRFPAAKRDAEKLVGDFTSRRPAWLMDLYLYPPLGIRREFDKSLEAPAASAPRPAQS
jgi:hypothetical protein